jgi:hypothetical protein
MFNVCQTVTIRLQVGFPRGKLRIGDTEQPLRNVIAQHEHPEATATGGKAFKAAGLGMGHVCGSSFSRRALGTRFIVTSFTRSARPAVRRSTGVLNWTV